MFGDYFQDGRTRGPDQPADPSNLPDQMLPPLPCVELLREIQGAADSLICLFHEVGIQWPLIQEYFEDPLGISTEFEAHACIALFVSAIQAMPISIADYRRSSSHDADTSEQALSLHILQSWQALLEENCIRQLLQHPTWSPEMLSCLEAVLQLTGSAVLDASVVDEAELNQLKSSYNVILTEYAPDADCRAETLDDLYRDASPNTVGRMICTHLLLEHRLSSSNINLWMQLHNAVSEDDAVPFLSDWCADQNALKGANTCVKVTQQKLLEQQAQLSRAEAELKGADENLKSAEKNLKDVKRTTGRARAILNRYLPATPTSQHAITSKKEFESAQAEVIVLQKQENAAQEAHQTAQEAHQTTREAQQTAQENHQAAEDAVKSAQTELTAFQQKVAQAAASLKKVSMIPAIDDSEPVLCVQPVHRVFEHATDHVLKTQFAQRLVLFCLCANIPWPSIGSQKATPNALKCFKNLLQDPGFFESCSVDVISAHGELLSDVAVHDQFTERYQYFQQHKAYCLPVLSVILRDEINFNQFRNPKEYESAVKADAAASSVYQMLHQGDNLPPETPERKPRLLAQCTPEQLRKKAQALKAQNPTLSAQIEALKASNRQAGEYQSPRQLWEIEPSKSAQTIQKAYMEALEYMGLAGKDVGSFSSVLKSMLVLLGDLEALEQPPQFYELRVIFDPIEGLKLNQGSSLSLTVAFKDEVYSGVLQLERAQDRVALYHFFKKFEGATFDPNGPRLPSKDQSINLVRLLLQIKKGSFEEQCFALFCAQLYAEGDLNFQYDLSELSSKDKEVLMRLLVLLNVDDAVGAFAPSARLSSALSKLSGLFLGSGVLSCLWLAAPFLPFEMPMALLPFLPDSFVLMGSITLGLLLISACLFFGSARLKHFTFKVPEGALNGASDDASLTGDTALVPCALDFAEVDEKTLSPRQAAVDHLVEEPSQKHMP